MLIGMHSETGPRSSRHCRRFFIRSTPSLSESMQRYQPGVPDFFRSACVTPESAASRLPLLPCGLQNPSVSFPPVGPAAPSNFAASVDSVETPKMQNMETLELVAARQRSRTPQKGETHVHKWTYLELQKGISRERLKLANKPICTAK